MMGGGGGGGKMRRMLIIQCAGGINERGFNYQRNIIERIRWEKTFATHNQTRLNTKTVEPSSGIEKKSPNPSRRLGLACD